MRLLSESLYEILCIVFAECISGGVNACVCRLRHTRTLRAGILMPAPYLKTLPPNLTPPLSIGGFWGAKPPHLHLVFAGEARICIGRAKPAHFHFQIGILFFVRNFSLIKLYTFHYSQNKPLPHCLMIFSRIFVKFHKKRKKHAPKLTLNRFFGCQTTFIS